MTVLIVLASQMSLVENAVEDVPKRMRDRRSAISAVVFDLLFQNILTTYPLGPSVLLVLWVLSVLLIQPVRIVYVSQILSTVYRGRPCDLFVVTFS